MRLFSKVVVSAAALALAGGLFIAPAQAAPAVGKVAVSSQLDLVAAKKKVAAKKPAKAKKKAKAGPGSCGTMMYWDKKTKKCANAMFKKA